MADTNLIERARALLENVTPLSFDCGTLCGHKCCTDFEPGVGVYLIPGELPLFDGSEDWITWQFHRTDEYDFAPSWSKHRQIPFMQCTRLCSREKRPFECRTYPLVPYLEDDGSLTMRYSPWALGVCPLTERYQLAELQPAFVEAAREAWTLLLEDPEMLDHIRWVTEQIRMLDQYPLVTEE